MGNIKKILGIERRDRNTGSTSEVISILFVAKKQQLVNKKQNKKNCEDARGGVCSFLQRRRGTSSAFQQALMEGEEDYFDGEELLYTGDLEEALIAMENSRRTATESRSTLAIPTVPNLLNTTHFQSQAAESEVESARVMEASGAGSASVKRSSSPSPPTTEYTDAAMYQPTGFGDIGNFMRNKRLKLGMQHRAMLEDEGEHEERRQIFKGLHVYVGEISLGGNGSSADSRCRSMDSQTMEIPAILACDSW